MSSHAAGHRCSFSCTACCLLKPLARQALLTAAAASDAGKPGIWDNAACCVYMTSARQFWLTASLSCIAGNPGIWGDAACQARQSSLQAELLGLQNRQVICWRISVHDYHRCMRIAQAVLNKFKLTSAHSRAKSSFLPLIHVLAAIVAMSKAQSKFAFKYNSQLTKHKCFFGRAVSIRH